jgi:F-type H+-transporting ATPase subunit gamma
MEKVFENLSDYPRFMDAREISRDIISRYISGEVDRVVICYTRFKNPAEQFPSLLKLLPIKLDGQIKITDETLEVHEELKSGTQKGKKDGLIQEFVYDPSPQDVLGSILPEYIYTTVYGALLEATASETGARMTAMKSASENAEEMIKELVLMYHRARQQQITMEIAEIVSGAYALSGD